MIRETKFHKSRLVPLHETARAGLERYLQQRRPYAPFDDHVFISLRRKPLLIQDVETAFRTVVDTMGLPADEGRRGPRPIRSGTPLRSERYRTAQMAEITSRSTC